MEEFFAGGQGAAIVFLYHCGGARLHPFEVIVQCVTDAGDEFAQSRFVPFDAWRSYDRRAVVRVDQCAGGSKSEPGVHIFGGDRGAGAAKCSFDGYHGISAGDPAIVIVEQGVLDRVWGVAGRPWGHDPGVGRIGRDDRCADHHSFSFFVEGLIFSIFALRKAVLSL